MNVTGKKNRWYIIVLLIVAGESVFILPFVLARIFRPTFLAAFVLTNLQLGYCFSIYGFVALASYLFGGVIADKIQPRKLMAIALWLTALGGLVLASYPNYTTLKVLYGYWGFTTIFLFWAAMIKATRIWGGTTSQGKAFGFLDGGRGLVAALFGSLGVLIFSFFIDAEIAETSITQREEAFSYVILVSSAIVAVVGIFVYFLLKLKEVEVSEEIKNIHTKENFRKVLKLPAVWLLMIIILCAYVGYKITDVFSLYASDVMGYSEVDAAKTGTYLLYIRPVVGLLIGFLADRSRPSVYLVGGFAFSIIGSLIYASGIIGPDMNFVFLMSIFITALGIYSARVLYFAVLREGKIPLAITGTAVGVISFIGYTPDIFAGPMMGVLLDDYPGELGHQYVFLILAIFALVGLVASFIFMRLARR
ncbi:MAG: MFS transporter [Flavobacteriaceae bacterium]|nr:MFS transporter [Flavobacteriaceae bacterium]